MATTGHRQDGYEKVTGDARYTADLTQAGLAHGRFKRAGIAHARIRRLDLSRARALPGVLAVIGQADVPAVRYGPFVKDRTLFATDVVRWEGEVVAAVAAVTTQVAARALELIELELEPLPFVFDLEAALEDASPLVHDDWAEYDAGDDVIRKGNVASVSSIVRGDADAALVEAEVVVRSRYVADASQAAPLEPRAILAQWQGDRVTVWSSTQVPFAAREFIADTLQLPQRAIRVIVSHLGGGFGSKSEGHFEPHVVALARAARRPVRVVLDRTEEFLLPSHRRERMVFELESGVTRDGRLLAQRGRILVDNGAYSGSEPYFSQVAAMHAAGPYRLPNVDITSHCIYTNTQPTGAVRAPTAAAATWAREQHVDAIADRLGMDALEFRRQNLMRSGDESPTGQVFDDVSAIDVMDRAAELIGYGQDLPADEAVGLSCSWQFSYAFRSGAYIKVDPDGSPTIITGAQECGTGAVMALPILASDILGIDASAFTVRCQDTDVGPWDAGSVGSQTTFNNGRAVTEAALEVRERLLELAEERLEAAKWDLELVDGVARVKGTRAPFVTIADLAADAHAGGGELLGRGAGKLAQQPEADVGLCTGPLGAEAMTAPSFSCHAAHVRVDRETGEVRVLRVAAVHDPGTVINPIGARGQVTGGVVMGLGQVLTESMRFGHDARVHSPNYQDYKLLTAADVPEILIDFLGHPASDAGPKGSRGMGEPPAGPTPGAVANAIARAIGARVHELPATPERVWAAIGPRDMEVST